MAEHADPRNSLAGVVGFFPGPESLLAAAAKIREAGFQSFDCYSPYPVHGLDQAQGLKRSPLPWITMGAGLTGAAAGFGLQYWTSAVSWPLNVGGKPLNSWPAFVPVMFETTVLFAGLATFAGMCLLNRLPNITRRIPDPSLTRDRFAIMIDAPASADDEAEALEAARRKGGGFKPFSEAEAQAALRAAGATDVRGVKAEGWF